MQNIVELKKISKSYLNGKNNRLRVLDDIYLKIEKKELTAVIGKSGSGKSTLLNILGCVDGFDSGEYLFCGKNISDLNDRKMSKLRGSDISFVFQDYALIEDETVLQNVMTPLYFDSGIKIGNMKKMAVNALEIVGIAELAGKKASFLSGGQKQRVAIARAIVNSPKLLLADEPTGSLDTKTAGEIMQLFHKLNDDGMTIIIVTHDMDVANECNKIFKIENGKLFE